VIEIREKRGRTSASYAARNGTSALGRPAWRGAFPLARRPAWARGCTGALRPSSGGRPSGVLSAKTCRKRRNRSSSIGRKIDANGEPTRVIYALSANSPAMLDYNLARARESLTEAGTIRVLVPDLLPDFGWHPLGTCWMGENPSRSVVDGYGPIFTSSTEAPRVTGSSVNPAATIAAATRRIGRGRRSPLGRMPSAPDMNLAEAPVDVVLAHRPDLVSRLRLALRPNAVEPAQALESLSAEAPECFAALIAGGRGRLLHGWPRAGDMTAPANFVSRQRTLDLRAPSRHDYAVSLDGPPLSLWRSHEERGP
jgi:hypothetical protein